LFSANELFFGCASFALKFNQSLLNFALSESIQLVIICDEILDGAGESRCHCHGVDSAKSRVYFMKLVGYMHVLNRRHRGQIQRLTYIVTDCSNCSVMPIAVSERICSFALRIIAGTVFRGTSSNTRN
jgi:predicted hydrocarbon binding protein